ncbi:tetratricopeptide repeat protein 1-like [Lampetra fluviatilis]
MEEYESDIQEEAFYDCSASLMEEENDSRDGAGRDKALTEEAAVGIPGGNEVDEVAAEEVGEGPVLLDSCLDDDSNHGDIVGATGSGGSLEKELCSDMFYKRGDEDVIKDVENSQERMKEKSEVVEPDESGDLGEESDAESILEEEMRLSDEEKERRRDEAMMLKESGNQLFKQAEYQQAADTYTRALKVCLRAYSSHRAVLYSNRAAAHQKMGNTDKAIQDCTKAVGLDPGYARARGRRAELYEASDKLDEALEDYRALLVLEPTHGAAREACVRLPEQIHVRNEKMKEEMLGKLKDLGNLLLRPFGLSTQNFQFQQDPDTGSYSVNFNQNKNS